MKQVEECYHCGEPCEDEIIQEEEKSFCCNGCHMVYQVLDQNDLNQYYQLNNKPGVQQKVRTSREKLAYLDDESIRNKLIDFSDGGTTRISFHLPQIHCSSCIWLLEKLPVLQEGIFNARVDYMKKEIYVNFDESVISIRKLVEVLINLGYEPLINLERMDKKEKKNSTQTTAFYIKLGVVGFCFGNIMLLSFPEYLGITSFDQQLVEVFGYLNILLSIPVFFYGANDYLRSAWSAIKHKGVNIDVPISLGILALFARSLYEIISDTGAGYLDSLSALIFLLLIGKWFQQKTFDNINFERDYKSYFPIAVTRMVNGEEQSIPLSKVEKGDILRIHHGELIPADAHLLKGRGKIDYSFVTGESRPITKQEGELIYAGGRQQGSAIDITIVKDVSQSYLTSLWSEQEFQQEQAHDFNNWTNRVGKYFTMIVLLISTIAATYWWQERGAEFALYVFAAVLIVACPCALALNVPFTLGNTLRILARAGFYIKDTNAVERMASLTDVVFDKTGTITASDQTQVQWEGETLTPKLRKNIAALMKQSLHPVSVQVSTYLNENVKGITIEGYQEVEGKGIQGQIEGQAVQVGSASFVGVDAGSQPKELQTVTYVSVNGKVLGKFILQQTLREGMRPLIEQMGTSYQLSLLSGDNEGEKERLQEVFGQETPLYFQQSPQDKMNYIRSLQQQGQKVMMLGDGLNDAGALKTADVGVAVAVDVHHFSPACDAILSAEQLKRLFSMVNFTKNSIKVVKLGFVISLMYNTVGLLFAVSGNLSPIIAAILMPLSSISVVGVGVLLTSWLGRRMKSF
ncbi:heavy metal translocating P-type ATPase [Algivirga pacifica]|uniref:Heavy metal translocating P-type ATPase metal-binding domain-containing protein n=1 Tax=Algivirga pacifica TaxID=1162670 RepID=A0ABP9CXT3_9BACT